MRYSFIVVASAVVFAACSEPGVGPSNSLSDAPTLQFTQLGGDPATEDLCGGLSPCDAYDYRGDGSVGAPGVCFLPPSVENHVSEEACSAPNRPGLTGYFQLAWCKVEYPSGSTAEQRRETAPIIVDDTCQSSEDWVDLVESSGFYSGSVRWRRNDPLLDEGENIFRVYVVRGDQMYAHRDLIVDPNLTTPADDYVHAIGYGNEPIKVRITQDFDCVKFDTQQGGTLNAATCLITSGTFLEFVTGEQVTRFNFEIVEEPFLADFEVSECSLLTDLVSGVETPLVDVPLADCEVSLESYEVDELSYPATIEILVDDARWNTGGVFENARLNVLQYDEYGIATLPPSEDPGWFGTASSSSAALRWLDWGLDRLADVFLPEPLYALRGTGWDFTRMSDFQVAVMPVMAPDVTLGGSACSSGEPYCLDISPSGGEQTVEVRVKVSAPYVDGPATYPTNHIPVPDARLHFFAQSGTVSCTGVPAQGSGVRGCVEAGEDDDSSSPPMDWGHVVVVTGTDGIGAASWDLEPGGNTLYVVACGIARPGDSEPDPPSEPGSDNVWGDLGDCADREVAMTFGYDNGPADGFTPFEPVDTDAEAAIYARPLQFQAATCGAIEIDGVKEDVWESCAQQTVFTAPQKGPKVEDNAVLYTYSDGEALYIGVEVASQDLGNRIFLSLTEGVSGGDGVEAPGDELLVVDDLGETGPGTFADWYLTAQCLGNNSASLCGEVDTGTDDAGKAMAGAAGVGSGTVFYELKRPFESGNHVSPKEDLAAMVGDTIGLRVTVTQGQGGGKGGFVYPDPQTSSTSYHVFTIE